MLLEDGTPKKGPLCFFLTCCQTNEKTNKVFIIFCVVFTQRITPDAQIGLWTLDFELAFLSGFAPS